MSNLVVLFDLVYNESVKLRKKDNKADGLKFWKPIKNELSKFDNITTTKWKTINAQDKKFLNIPEYYIDGNGNKKTIELHHFLIQTIRIPLTEKPSLRKIIQLALNIGQYEGIINKKEKWMRLDYYLTKKDIREISTKIPDYLIEKIREILR